MKLLPQLILALLLCPLFLSAQSDALIQPDTQVKKKKKEKKATIFEFLSKDPSVTEVTLTTNIDSLVENKYRDFEVPSTYTYVFDGQDFKWDVQISPRGKSRKKICDMPPFLINFSKNDLKKEGLKKKHDKLKLVNYCKKGKWYESYLLKEYITYKIYNILTEYSFRAKLINITYIDAENDIDPTTKYSFLIESTDEMADRLKAKEVDYYEIPADSCSSFDYDVLCLFQYMISNTDWNLGLLHNTKLIKKKKTGKYFPIPYDFDYSGLVNTDYSVPNPDYPQSSIRQRIYIGEYPSDEEITKVVKRFLDTEDEVFALINDFELLDKGWKKNMTKFLKKFYKDIKNLKKLKRKCLSSQKDYRAGS